MIGHARCLCGSCSAIGGLSVACSAAGHLRGCRDEACDVRSQIRHLRRERLRSLWYLPLWASQYAEKIRNHLCTWASREGSSCSYLQTAPYQLIGRKWIWIIHSRWTEWACTCVSNARTKSRSKSPIHMTDEVVRVRRCCRVHSESPSSCPNCRTVVVITKAHQ